MPFSLSSEDRSILILFVLDAIITLGAILYLRLGDFIFVSESKGKTVAPTVYFSFRSLVLLRAHLLWLRTLITPLTGTTTWLSSTHGWPLLFGEGVDVDLETLAQV